MAEQGIVKAERAELVAAEAPTNAALVYLASLAPTGRRTMAGALATCAALLGSTVELAPWAALRYEHVAAIRAKLAETMAPATVNKHLAALRGTARAAWRMGQMDAEQYARLADVKGMTGETLPAGRALGPGELGAMLRTCGETPAGIRDGAILALAYAAGLRRAELAGLDLADVTGDDGETVTLRILGKRSKERLVYLDNGARLALLDWLSVRGTEAGPLFWAGKRGGHLVRGAGMTPQAIRDVVARAADRAGVASASPHDLRRSFVSDLLDAGVDIATVASMAGHANIETTRRYDRRGEAAKKRGARALHVPYAKRRLPEGQG
jgi:site-specific recombinase XerD